MLLNIFKYVSQSKRKKFLRKENFQKLLLSVNICTGNFENAENSGEVPEMATRNKLRVLGHKRQR